MVAFADTSAWFALFVESDQNHAAAQDWFSRNRSPVFTTDYVVDETLTLLRARGEHAKALSAGERFFSGELCRIYYLDYEDIQNAWAGFQQFSDKEWSFTDCTSKVVMERLELTQAFAFDQHFRQFGTVEVVP